MTQFSILLYLCTIRSVESRGLNFTLLHTGILTGQLVTKNPQIWLAESKYYI